MPDATPVEEPTVATEVMLLLHVPPPVASLSANVFPAQNPADPVIVAGRGDTVTVAKTDEQLNPKEYVMIVVPAEMPETIPVEEPIVAMVVLPLVHTPPVIASLKVTGLPAHVFSTPVIADGIGVTVTVAYAEVHPTTPTE